MSPITIGVAVAVGCLIGLWLAHGVINQGCNGHHWGDARTRIGGDVHAEYDDNYGHESRVLVYKEGVQYCQDCGESKETDVLLKVAMWSELEDPQ